LRAQLGNDIAIKAFKEGTLPLYKGHNYGYSLDRPSPGPLRLVTAAVAGHPLPWGPFWERGGPVS
jgi:hypothetical protein